MGYDCGATRCDRDDPHQHSLNDNPCPVEGCDNAYPHPLLTDKHIVDEHPQFIEEALSGADLADV